MRESTKTAVAVLCVIVLAGAFWLVLLAPKRDKANELSEQVTAISAEVAAAQGQLATATAAKHNFAGHYARLVELGKAVPPEADTPSLLAQLQGISRRAKSSFVSIGVASTASTGESEASLTGAQLPLGASVGAIGLPAMPYSLEFVGGFFEIAKFIHELDALVTTDNEEVDATGRLVTIDSFSLVPKKAENNEVSGKLEATFQVTTYVAPSGEGLTAGATAAGPGIEEAAAAEAETTSTETETSE